MLKLVESAVTFAEYPDEIALVINLSLCPNHCLGCSSAYLAEDIGEELTEAKLEELIDQHPGITLVGFGGGDNDHSAICNLANFVHAKGLKVGMYSGRDYLDLDLANVLDYYKIGSWRMFTGSEDTWKNQTAGPLTLPTSNQIMFKRENGKLVNITDKFRTKKINDWKKEII